MSNSVSDKSQITQCSTWWQQKEGSLWKVLRRHIADEVEKSALDCPGAYFSIMLERCSKNDNRIRVKWRQISKFPWHFNRARDKANNSEFIKDLDTIVRLVVVVVVAGCGGVECICACEYVRLTLWVEPEFALNGGRSKSTTLSSYCTKSRVNTTLQRKRFY